jgi:hypothetical protein
MWLVPASKAFSHFPFGLQLKVQGKLLNVARVFLRQATLTFAVIVGGLLLLPRVL